MSLNVTKEVALLKQMTVGQLRERYLQVTGEATQAANRKWLVRRIIWRMQSIEEGGLSERAIARARELASGADLRTTSPKQRSLPADADRRTRVVVDEIEAASVRQIFELYLEHQSLLPVPGKGYFAIIRLYGPTGAAIEKSWKLGDFQKIN